MTVTALCPPCEPFGAASRICKRKVFGLRAMKLRRLFLVVLLVGGFWYLTSHLPSKLSDVSLSHFSLVGAEGSRSPLELTEAQAAPAYDAGEAEQYCRLQAGAAVGGEHHFKAGGLQLLLRRSAAGGAGFGIHSRQGRPRADQLPRGRGRQSRHRGDAEQQEPHTRPRWSAPTRCTTWRCCRSMRPTCSR